MGALLGAVEGDEGRGFRAARVTASQPQLASAKMRARQPLWPEHCPPALPGVYFSSIGPWANSTVAQALSLLGGVDAKQQADTKEVRYSIHRSQIIRLGDAGMTVQGVPFTMTPAQNEQSRMKASLGIPSLDTRTSKCSVYSPRPPHPHHTQSVKRFPTLITESLEQWEKTSGLL